MAEILKDREILEVMSGSGLNIPIFENILNPASITLVDINEDAIEEFRKNDINNWYESHASELIKWTRERTNCGYKAIIGIWCLSYLDETAVNEFLNWATMNSRYLILIEPVHENHSG